MIRLSCACQLGRRQRLDAIDAFKLPDHSLAWQNPTSRNLHTRWDKFGDKLEPKIRRLRESACFSPQITRTICSTPIQRLELSGPWNSKCSGESLLVIQILSVETQDPNRPKRLRLTFILRHLCSLPRRSITI
jgi:hypothetical protein